MEQEKNCKNEIEVFNISKFYEEFKKEKRKYPPSLFCINKVTSKKRKRAPTFQEFKKVIYEYLKIYFFELYMNKKPMYFCLSGMMKVVVYEPWQRKQKRSNLSKETICYSSGALGLFWYFRPNQKSYYMVQLKKLSGSTNMITKIEAIFKKNNNKDLLPIFTEELKRGKTNKTLYRCIQK